MQIFSRTYRSCHVYKHLVLQNRRPFISSSQSPWSLFRGLDSRGFSCPSGFTSCYCSSSAASSQENLNISDEQIVAELTDGQEKTDTSAALEPQATKEIPEQQLKSKREVPALRRNAAEKDSEAEEFQPKREGLYSLFKEPSRRKKDAPPRREKMKIERTESRLSDKPLKELSPEFLSFLNRLHEEGCLKEANCMKGGELNLDSLSHYYFRGFLKSAAEKFGHSHRLIAKYLSGSDLKKVALFGCPTVEQKTVFAAKDLRSFFSIEEDVVCRACKLKSSCKFVNRRVGKKANVLPLMGALRLLTSYALEADSQPVVISDDMKLSINKLLKDVVNLSQ